MRRPVVEMVRLTILIEGLRQRESAREPVRELVGSLGTHRRN
jgi:hypothetical protein